MDTKEFDSIHETGKRLKEIFARDKVCGMDGLEDYLVRSVEEASHLTKRAPDWIYWCCKCGQFNIYTNKHCASCGKQSSR
jgi:hypothetical protein